MGDEVSIKINVLYSNIHRTFTKTKVVGVTEAGYSRTSTSH